MSETGGDRVECYSGYTYPQEPRAVVWRGRRFPVVGIERRWRTPAGPRFRVETEAGIPFELHYAEVEDTWTIQPLSELDADVPEAGDRAAGGNEISNRGVYRSHREDKEVREER